MIRYHYCPLLSVECRHWCGQVHLLCSTLVQGVFIGLQWSSLFMMVFVGLECLSARMVQHVYVGVLWCSGLVWCGSWCSALLRSDVFVLGCCPLVWPGVVMVVCSGPELWFWASSTHDHLRCSLQLRLRLCLTSRMKVSFYEAGDVPAVWLCFHPNSLLNVSRQSCQNQ